MDDYIHAMSQALSEAEKPSPEAHPKWGSYSISRLTRHPTAAWAGILAAITVMILLVPWQGQVPPYELQLHSLRGDEASLEAIAPANTPLVLTVDLTGLPPSSAHEVEIADSAGNSIWTSTDRRLNDSITLEVDATLKPGQYWFRVYESPAAPGLRGQLLREFNLRIQ